MQVQRSSRGPEKGIASTSNNRGRKEYEVEKILNKSKFRGKDRYLVQWKGYIAEEDIQKPRENLGNAEELVKEFEEEYGKDIGQSRGRITKEEIWGELLGRYTAKMLYGWDDKRFDQEYWGLLERNWKKQKRKGKEWLERIDKEEEEEEIVERKIEEWNEEDELGNLRDYYNKL